MFFLMVDCFFWGSRWLSKWWKCAVATCGNGVLFFSTFGNTRISKSRHATVPKSSEAMAGCLWSGGSMAIGSKNPHLSQLQGAHHPVTCWLQGLSKLLRNYFSTFRHPMLFPTKLQKNKGKARGCWLKLPGMHLRVVLFSVLRPPIWCRWKHPINLSNMSNM